VFHTKSKKGLFDELSIKVFRGSKPVGITEFLFCDESMKDELEFKVKISTGSKFSEFNRGTYGLNEF
jgi:hypothetical protein